MALYTVITGDIIGSRKYEGFNKLIREKLSKIVYPENMIAPFKLSRGDEIQALFKGYLAFPGFIRQVRYILRPMELRLGIGYGKINEVNEITKISDSWTLNGPAFHYARESLEAIDNSDQFKTRFMSNNEIDEAINTILFLIDTIQEEWTEAQWEAVYYYEKLGTYKKAAEILKIAPQNVNKRCKTARWKEIEHAEKSISRLVEKFIE
ncbi:MAG: hypothetical protein GX336_01400 [Halanaerobiaceae bacterium]|nr:hypothetical protein [Halanaerobiaceae bacterium]